MPGGHHLENRLTVAYHKINMQVASAGQTGQGAYLVDNGTRRQPDPLPALSRLREEIHRVEEAHPGLNSGLTAVCDAAITKLQSNPANTAPQIVPGRHGPLTRMLDRTGHYLVLGLDKAGDGIIMFFEMLLKLSVKKKV